MHHRPQTHERLSREEPAPGLGSHRSFGFTLTVVFVALALLPLLSGAPPRWWLLAAAAGVFAVSLVKADLLAPFHRAWYRLGLALHRLVSPVVLAVIYFGVVTPTGLVMRALGKDLLGLRLDRQARSYWIHREPPGPDAESMKNQF